MIVVSDTSPIRALAHIDCLRHLGQLFDTVLMTPWVVDELERPERDFVSVPVSRLSFVRIMAPVDSERVAAITRELDPPEAQSLALALEQRVDLVAMDEADGRAVAARLGLTCIGALGILSRMRRRGLIGELKPMIVRLRDELRFRMSDSLIAEVLASVGESPDKI